MTESLKPCKQTGHAYHAREDDLRHCAQCCGVEASIPTMCPGRMMTEMEQNEVQKGTLDFSRGPGIKPQWWVTKDRMDEELAYHRAQDDLLEQAQKEAKALREELAETKRPLNDQMARLNQSLIEANQTILGLRRGTAHPTVVPEDVARAAKIFVDAGYRGPLAMAKKVFDWVHGQKV